MFNIRDFLKKGFIDAVGKMADYQIILNAMGYMDKGILTVEDLTEIQAAIDAHNASSDEHEEHVPDFDPETAPDPEHENPQE